MKITRFCLLFALILNAFFITYPLFAEGEDTTTASVTNNTTADNNESPFYRQTQVTIRQDIVPDTDVIVDNLGIKNPVFFISEGLETSNHDITGQLCNTINSAVNSKENITCLIYPVNNRADIASYMRRGAHSDKFSEAGINGDFLVVRNDLLKLASIDKTGPFASAPDLDVVMYLNGEYFFMFTDLQRESFSLEQMIVSKGRRAKITVGFLNPQSRAVFESLVAPKFSDVIFTYKAVPTQDLTNVLCYPSGIDVYVYLGSSFTPQIQSAMSACGRNIVPLGFSDSFLSKLLDENPVLSVANVIHYYDPGSVMSYVETFVRVEKKYRQQLSNINNRGESTTVKVISEEPPTATVSQRREQRQQSRAHSGAVVRTTVVRTVNSGSTRAQSQAKQDEQDEQPEQIEQAKSEPTVETNSQMELREKANQTTVLTDESLDSLPGVNRKLDNQFTSVFPSLRRALTSSTTNTDSVVYVSSNTYVKTFGIRNVLVASRYTRQDNVIKVFDLLVKNYLFIKDNFLTPDMKTFSLSDIIIGTSKSYGLLTYHPGVYHYPRIMLENPNPKTREQSAAIRILTASLKGTPPPSAYGPTPPTSAQLTVIYQQLKNINTRKQELAAIRIFQRDIENAQRALELLRNGQEIPDSILRSTGLLGSSIITGDNVSVLPVDIAEEQNREDFSGEAIGEGVGFTHPRAESDFEDDDESIPEETDVKGSDTEDEESDEEVASDEDNTKEN